MLSVVVVRVHPLSMEQHVPVIFLDLNGTNCTPVMFSFRSIVHWLTKCLCHLLVILQPLFIKSLIFRSLPDDVIIDLLLEVMSVHPSVHPSVRNSSTKKVFSDLDLIFGVWIDLDRICAPKIAFF